MKPRPIKRMKPTNPATVQLVKQILIGVLLFTFIGLVLVGIWYGTRVESLNISQIKISGAETIKEDRVRQLAQDTLDGAYLGLVPKKFILFYPKEKLLNDISAIPRIKNVQVELSSNKSLEVSFSEYYSEALWCDVKSEKGCYFIDETGFPFDKAPNLAGGIFIRYYSLGIDAALGNRPFTTEDYTQIKQFIGWLAGIGWNVYKVEIDSVRDVFYSLTPGGEIRSSLTTDTSKQFYYLETLLKSPEFAHLVPGSFQYVDVRFGTKVYVNEESEIDIELSTSTDKEIEVSNGTSSENRVIERQ